MRTNQFNQIRNKESQLPCKNHRSSFADDVMKMSSNETSDTTRKTPVVILGPTTVGKTEVAFGLARECEGEVINADKFYLYDGIPGVTGQSDADEYADVSSHLYGILKPNEDLLSETEYAAALRTSHSDIRARGARTIIEGCSNALARTAIETLKAMGEAPIVVGLRWRQICKLPSDCERRATSMIQGGMAQSFNSAYEQGMGDTYLLRKCFAKSPLMAHRKGRTSLARCRNRVAEQLEQHARRHYEMLGRIRDVRWIDHDRNTPEETVGQIVDNLKPIAG